MVSFSSPRNSQQAQFGILAGYIPLYYHGEFTVTLYVSSVFVIHIKSIFASLLFDLFVRNCWGPAQPEIPSQRIVPAR
jgi:hypothetical protein